MKIIGLATLICFSFFYTEKVIDVINEQDPIMIKINSVKDKYIVKPVEAIINEDTIIPGIVGKEVNAENSYNAMRKIGLFKSNLLEYDNIMPKDTLSNNLDKYIINGNKEFAHVSLILIITKDNINKIDSLDNKHLNLFIDSGVLKKNLAKIKKLSNTSIYSYGDNGRYNKDNLTIDNNLIQRNTKNKGTYCLMLDKNKDNIKQCQNSNMSSLLPLQSDTSSAYNSVKLNLQNGLMMVINTDSKTISELDDIIKYIKSKGYKIVALDKLLNENI